jgi:DNA processing protein
MEINKLNRDGLPARLREIHTAPKQLFVTGANLDELLTRKSVAIVGSRKVTPYGRQVTADLAGRLAEQGVVIVSGLALGVDAIAHQAALEAGGLTIAVLPSPVEAIYPAGHRRLAMQILEQGGALVSEFPAGTKTFPGNFIARNRIVSGLGDALLITEAAEKSGTLHTARFALEQGRDVLAVPGNITSQTSIGTNNLIKAGATPVTSYEDVMYVLGLHTHATTISQVYGRNAEEQTVLDLLLTGNTDGEALQKASKLDIATFNQTLTMLEISGKIRPLGANQWALA